MRRWIVFAVMLAGCKKPSGGSVVTTWDGRLLTCDDNTLVLRDVTATVLRGPDGYAIHASGTCQLVIERSVLSGSAGIVVRGNASLELRDVQMDGSLLVYDSARVVVTSVRPASANGNLTVHADGDGVLTIRTSHLRGDRPLGGNGRRVLDVADTKLEGREKDGAQVAVHTWGSARVKVRGGEVIGTVFAQGSGVLDLKPATWASSTLDAVKTLKYVRCLATTDVQIRSALATVAAGGAPSVSGDWVRVCADEIVAVAAMTPRLPARDDPAATWAAQLLPIAAKLDQLKRYVDAGDNKDDGGARGKMLREQLASASAELETASAAFAGASLGDRVKAYAWWRHRAGTVEGAVIDLFIAAEELGLTSGKPEPTAVAAALDVASTASTALLDLVADRTVIDKVTSFWAVDSGYATTWSALETAMRALHDEIKRVRRDLKDANKPVGLAQLARIGELVAVAHDHYARLKFPPPVESPVR